MSQRIRDLSQHTPVEPFTRVIGIVVIGGDVNDVGSWTIDQGHPATAVICVSRFPAHRVAARKSCLGLFYEIAV